MTLNELMNSSSVYVWRFLVLIMLGLFGFFGTRLYASIDRNSIAVYELVKISAFKTDLAPLQTDIRELRREIRELNYHLRDKTKAGGG